jgi:hypothetical protein
MVTHSPAENAPAGVKVRVWRSVLRLTFPAMGPDQRPKALTTRAAGVTGRSKVTLMVAWRPATSD